MSFYFFTPFAIFFYFPFFYIFPCFFLSLRLLCPTTPALSLSFARLCFLCSAAPIIPIPFVCALCISVCLRRVFCPDAKLLNRLEHLPTANMALQECDVMEHSFDVMS
jgi:hypothetical protein